MVEMGNIIYFRECYRGDLLRCMIMGFFKVVCFLVKKLVYVKWVNEK